MMVIYEAIWEEIDLQEGVIITHSFLAETSYLAKTYCGAPSGTKVTIRKRKVMLNI